MNFLDTRSVLFTVSTIYILLPCIIWIAMVGERNRAVNTWCTGGLTYGIGVALIAGRDLIPEWLSMSVAQLIMTSGTLLRIKSLTILLNKAFPLPLLAAILGVWWGTFEYIHWVLQDVTLRLEWVSFSGIIFLFTLVILAWRISRQADSLNARLIAVAYITLAAAFLFRLLELSLWKVHVNEVFGSPGMKWVALTGIFSAMGGNLGFMGMSLERTMRSRLQLAAELARQEEHRQNAAALLESELKYRTLADSGPALIWSTDPNKHCEYVNQVWQHFTGRHREAVFGNGCIQDIHPDDLNTYVAVYQSRFNLQQKFSLTYRLRRQDGEFRWIEEQSCPRYDADGHFMGYISYGLDITDRKQLEESTQQAHRVYLEQISQLDRQRSLGEMSASLGHELNQPLTAILTNAQVLQRSLHKGLIEPQPLQDFVTRIIQNTRRASQIIEKIRGFIRPHTIEKRPLNLLAIAHETADLLKTETNRHQVALFFNAPAQPILIAGDAIQLSQVLLNILRNAIEVLKNQSVRHIYISFSQQADELHVRIRDSGPGLDETALEKAGSAFFSTKPDGLGMGLSISRSIIEQHQGRLLISNAPEGGACFDIYLPAMANDGDPQPAPI